MLQIFRISLLILILPLCADAQDRADAALQVRSNLEGSLILVDSAYVGTVSEAGVVRVEPGSHRVGVAPPEVGSWVLSPPETIVAVAAGDTAVITLDFPITYRIDTIPFGATVSREGEEEPIGETPLVFTTESALQSALVLEKYGFATERLIPGTDVINQHSVSLRPTEPSASRSETIEWRPAVARRRWLTYTALGLIAAGGVLAVHFKFRADDRYDEYLSTSDEATKAEVDRLDRLSYVALGGVQVGFGILIYRLAF